MWRQPKSVWAVAFASTLNATPSQVLLLFTSYMAVMGVAMLVTGVVSYGSTSVARTIGAGVVAAVAQNRGFSPQGSQSHCCGFDDRHSGRAAQLRIRSQQSSPHLPL